MKVLSFAEFCSLIEGKRLELTEHWNLGWRELDGFSCELLERTYKIKTPKAYIDLGERVSLLFEVSLWVSRSRCMKIVVTINQCEYLANQELVLRDENEIRRLREVLISDSQ